MSYDSASLTTPDIKWLGVRPSDLDKYKVRPCRARIKRHFQVAMLALYSSLHSRRLSLLCVTLQIPEQCRLPMTANDIKMGQELMAEDFIKANPAWVKVRASSDFSSMLA